MRYGLYGLTVESRVALPCWRSRRAGRADVTLAPVGSEHFWRLRRGKERWRPHEWFGYRPLSGGSKYLRWTDLFEFVVSQDGRQIRYRRFPQATLESLSAYLLGQVLSFSLLAFGQEPLHGTAVVVGGRAIGLLGDCGSGKSTLGAGFLSLGHRVLTDDLLVLQARASGYAVHPGMPRIKLFPSVSRRVLGLAGGPRLNDGTSKQVLPLVSRQAWRRNAPLAALYVLSDVRPKHGRITIEPLPAGQALLAVIRNSFNAIVLDRHRLAQQFRFASQVASRVPVKRLTYPRGLALLPTVCNAVLGDLTGVAWPPH